MLKVTLIVKPKLQIKRFNMSKIELSELLGAKARELPR